MQTDQTDSAHADDQELIALLEQKAPEHLTLEEIERLNARLPHLPHLQQFLIEQIQMEQYLATALARVDVRVDEILAGRRASNSASSRWRYRLALAVAVGLVLGLGSIWFVTQRWGGKPAGEQTAKKNNDKPQPGDKRLGTPEHAAGGTAPPTGNGAANVPGATDKPEDSPAKKPVEPAASPEAPGTKKPAASGPAPPPWEAADQLGGGRHPWAALALGDPPSRGIALTGDAVDRWFRPAGTAHVLKAPWPEDAMLRLRFDPASTMEIRFWKGNDGALFQFNGAHGWSSYRVTRSANELEPTSRELWETDDGRFWKFHAVDVTWRKRRGRFSSERNIIPNDTPLDFIFQDGAIQMWRGDMRLASAPLGGPPAVVQLKGDRLQHVSMAHTDRAPTQTRYEPAVALQEAQPARLPWIRQVAAPATMDGPERAARLVVPAGSQPAFAALKLEQLGLGDVVFQVVAATSGTAVYLGGPDGRPIAGAQLVHQDAVAVKLQGPWEPGAVAPEADMAIRPGESLWIRLLVASGSLRVWQSHDGKCWAYVGASPLPAGAAPISSFGVYAAPGTAKPRSITLRAVQVREYSGLNSLATPELIRAAPATPGITQAAWKQLAQQGQLGGVDPGQWHRAVALRTLSCGASEPVSSWLLRALLQDAASLPRTLAQNARLLAEFPDVAEMAWVEPWNGRPPQPITADLIEAAEDFANNAATEEDPRPFLTLGREILRGRRGPFTSLNEPFPTNLVVPEVMQLAAAQRYDALEETGRTARLYGRDETASVSRWAIEQVARHRRGEAADLPQQSDDGSVGLAIDTTKAQRMFIADLMDAIQAKRWDQACDLITHIEPAGRLEMFADPADALVWVPSSTEIAALVIEHPRLADRMRLKFAERGKLRVRFAIAENDVAAVTQAATQFAGTPAAAEAWQWIGDQLLRAGDASGALAWYRKAEPLADLALAEPLASRQRLAGAMLGRDVGRPRQSPVRFDSQEYDAAAFETLVQKAKAAAPASAGPPARPAVPSPSGFRLEEIAPPGGNRPWLPSGLAIAPAGPALLVQDSRTVAAYQMATGQPLWHRPLGQDNSALCWLPQLDGAAALFATAAGPGAQLSRIDMKSGEILSQSLPLPGPCFSGYEPMIAGQSAIAIGSRQRGKHGLLMLTSVNLKTGQIARETPLVPAPAAPLSVGLCPPLCIADAALVFVDGGIVCCETAGVIRWIRREHWLGTPKDAPSLEAVPTRSFAVDGDAIVWQHHVPYIERIDMARGHRKWLRMLPNTRRLLGLADQRLIVETENRLVALDAGTGKILWARPMDNLLAPVAIGPPGGILVVREKTLRPADPNRPGSLAQVCPELVWIDPASGRMTAVQSLDQLAAEKLALGPWAFDQSSITMFYGAGRAAEKGVQWDPNRKLLRLIVQGGPQPPRETQPPSLWDAGGQK